MAAKLMDLPTPIATTVDVLSTPDVGKRPANTILAPSPVVC
jgi:hypothetical protein